MVNRPTQELPWLSLSLSGQVQVLELEMSRLWPGLQSAKFRWQLGALPSAGVWHIYRAEEDDGVSS